MKICVAGDIHGAMDRLYQDVLAFEEVLGIRFNYVLQVGDFGVWPDSSRIDRATRRHDGPGDFSAWLRDNRVMPRPTLFIKGNHEDFTWLDSRSDTEVLPGLSYLRNGSTVDIGCQQTGVIRVGGIGGCYGPSDFNRRSERLQGYAKRHYTLDEIQTLSSINRLDILLTHDAPAGVFFESHRHGRGYISEAAGLDVLLARAQPRVCFFGHHHSRVDATVAGVRCVGLNKIGMPGNLVAIDIVPPVSAATWSVLGEYRRKEHGAAQNHSQKRPYNGAI